MLVEIAGDALYSRLRTVMDLASAVRDRDSAPELLAAGRPACQRAIALEPGVPSKRNGVPGWSFADCFGALNDSSHDEGLDCRHDCQSTLPIGRRWTGF